MKLLFDQNLSFKLCRQLADLFPNSDHARLLGLAEADDRALWQFAGANGYVLVTLDADFAELAALGGPPPKVIWLRCGNQATATVARLLREHHQTIAAFERDEAACLEIYPLFT
jgi:predicted nuclease of predicted toxin-antitoxin system